MPTTLTPEAEALSSGMYGGVSLVALLLFLALVYFTVALAQMFSLLVTLGAI